MAYSVNEVEFITTPVMPKVITGVVSDINATIATLNGEITSVGDLAITERGFVIATFQNPAIENQGVTRGIVSGSGNVFSVILAGLTTGRTYYVRAYTINSKGIWYGEQVSFTPEFLNAVVLPTAGLVVQKVDIGFGTWSTINSLCNNSILDGFTDWRLPTKVELDVLYNERAMVGGFISSFYWSSTAYLNAGYWVHFFGTDALPDGYGGETYKFYGRCVRQNDGNGNRNRQ
jgi:hypothetical protein